MREYAHFKLTKIGGQQAAIMFRWKKCAATGYNNVFATFEYLLFVIRYY